MDLNGYMAHFRKMLVKDGILVIAVPNYTSSDADRYKEYWAAYDVPRHLWHFSPKAMSELLSKHGFTLTKKIPMPLDAFYVSMLSEKYQDNRFFGPAAAFFSGIKTVLAEKKDVTRASSLIYISK